MPNPQSLIPFLLAYLLGSIPFGLIITRLAGLGDVRQIGSGNIGATNVLRTGNKKLAVLTLLLDGGKGYAAVWLARYIDPATIPVAALFAVIGHMFPVWLKFKGGKGVATAFGVYGAISPVAVAFLALIWLYFFVSKRYVSRASILSIGLAPVILYEVMPFDTTMIMVSIAIGILVIWRHKDNIKRLLAGTEPKFGKKP